MKHRTRACTGTARPRRGRSRSFVPISATLVAVAFACGGSGDGDGSDGSTGGSDGSTGADTSASSTSSTGTPGSGIMLDGGGSGSGGGGEGNGDDECGGDAVNAGQVPANLLLVIDRSESMLDTPAGFDEDKWTSLNDALATALEQLPATAALGLQLFPSPDDPDADNARCGMPSGGDLTVAVAGAEQAVPAVTMALDGATPVGSTPTAAALARAFDYFSAGPGFELPGNRFVLLATDGGPNCNPDLTCEADACTTNLDGDCPQAVENCCAGAAGDGCLDDEATLEQVQSLRDVGITTYVVGIPGSSDYADLLDELAIAGGAPTPEPSPRYYRVGDSAELAQVLNAITTQLVMTCDFQLAEQPPDPNKVNVFVDGEVVAQEGADGWEYDRSTSPYSIVLKGATCERVQTDGAQSVRFEFGCPTVRIR